MFFFSFWFNEIDEEFKQLLKVKITERRHGYGSPERTRFTHYFLCFHLTTR